MSRSGYTEAQIIAAVKQVESGRKVEEVAREVGDPATARKRCQQNGQHMQKAMIKMNIQLANVISDITGVSGPTIIGAILKGDRDPGNGRI